MEPPTRLDLRRARFEDLDGTGVLGLEGGDGIRGRVRRGLPTPAFDALRHVLGVSASELAGAVGVSPRTLARRRTTGRLAPDESDRLLRVARLTEMAAAALGDLEAGAAWMTETLALFGEPPLLHADTGPGAQAVEDALFAVEYTGAA